MGDFLKSSIDQIRDVVGQERVILGLSGGVDSSVAAALSISNWRSTHMYICRQWSSSAS